MFDQRFMSDIAGFSEQYGTQADVKILSTGFRLTHMSEFAGKTSPGVNFKQQLCQINRGTSCLTRLFRRISGCGSSSFSRLLMVRDGYLP